MRTHGNGRSKPAGSSALPRTLPVWPAAWMQQVNSSMPASRKNARLTITAPTILFGSVEEISGPRIDLSEPDRLSAVRVTEILEL